MRKAKERAVFTTPGVVDETRQRAALLREHEIEEQARKAREYLSKDAPKATGHGQP